MAQSNEHIFESLKIRLEFPEPNIVNVYMIGELDYGAYNELSLRFENLLNLEEPAFVIDMRELVFMDSSGIKFLSSLGNRYGFDNLVIVNANEDIMRIINLVALDRKIAFINESDQLERWNIDHRKAA